MKNKIVGYYNLRNLKKRLKSILLRREKKDVLKELPNVTQRTIPVSMSSEQFSYHAGYAKGIAQILSKKFITPYDMQRLMLLLSKMRMVCDSTFLVDQETNISPKLVELEHILIDKMDVPNTDRKIIIFSEWVKMNGLIGKMLQKNNITYAELNGKVPVRKRKKLIETFYKDKNCKIFLSSEAGGSGLNLQIADTLINFELPWNPAKKNQRIGRIDRLGQKNKNLTVLNFVTRHSIEMRIISGLVLKQNLFEGVLSESNTLDFVDFSSEGRAQFLNQLQEVIGEFNLEDFAPISGEEQEAVPSAMAEIAEFAKAENTDQNSNEQQEEGLKQAAKESQPNPAVEKAEQMQTVLTQGMGFLSSLMKMATGKELEMNEKSIEIDKDTGEVVMRFKL